MPTQKEETQRDLHDKKADELESSQASSGTPVREGQEDSSIRHDREDKNKELSGPVHKDNNAVNSEEFIDERNTKEE